MKCLLFLISVKLKLDKGKKLGTQIMDSSFILCSNTKLLYKLELSNEFRKNLQIFKTIQENKFQLEKDKKYVLENIYYAIEAHNNLELKYAAANQNFTKTIEEYNKVDCIKFKLKEKLVLNFNTIKIEDYNRTSIIKYNKCRTTLLLNNNKIETKFYALMHLTNNFSNSCIPNSLKITAKLNLLKLKTNDNQFISCSKKVNICKSDLRTSFSIREFNTYDNFVWKLEVKKFIFKIKCRPTDDQESMQISIMQSSKIKYKHHVDMKQIFDALKKYYTYIVNTTLSITPISYRCMDTFYQITKLNRYQKSCLQNMKLLEYQNYDPIVNTSDLSIYKKLDFEWECSVNTTTFSNNDYLKNRSKHSEMKKIIIDLLNEYKYSHSYYKQHFYIKQIVYLLNDTHKCDIKNNPGVCKLCKLCLFDTILSPCNHPVCGKCLKLIDPTRCPFCKLSILNTIKVFQS